MIIDLKIFRNEVTVFQIFKHSRTHSHKKKYFDFFVSILFLFQNTHMILNNKIKEAKRKMCEEK